MRAIYKYQLNTGSSAPQTKTMPEGAKILSVENQNENLCVWAEVDTNAEPEDHLFRVYGTGQNQKEFLGDYIGTVVMLSETRVWHVYHELDR